MFFIVIIVYFGFFGKLNVKFCDIMLNVLCLIIFFIFSFVCGIFYLGLFDEDML